MDLSVNYSMPMAKSMDYSKPSFKGKEKVAESVVKEGMSGTKNRRGSLMFFLQNLIFFTFIGLLAEEFVSISNTGKTLGQNFVEKTKQKIEEYRFEHGDIGTKTEILVKRMNRMNSSKSEGMLEVLEDLDKKIYQWQ